MISDFSYIFLVKIKMNIIVLPVLKLKLFRQCYKLYPVVNVVKNEAVSLK